MADIRIKDLTTLESASLTGDVFVIDGTTGTRKLSAFSPTFGGNATVTGTLTVNGGATVGGGSFAAASFYKSSSLGSVLSGATGSSYDLYITNPAGNYILQVPTGTRNAEFAGTLTTVGNATVGAALTVQATTASTTTSTGALVVSGGVGVAGAIVAGSFIRSAGANNISLGADAGKNRIDAGGATDTPVRALGTADALTGIEMRLLGIIDGTSAPAATAGYAKLYVDSADGDLKVIFGDGTVKTIATDS